MNTKKISVDGRIITVAAAMMVLAGVYAVHGQDRDEKGDDALITPVAYTSQDRRDPFEPYVIEEPQPGPIEPVEEEEVPLPPLKISGITWGSSFPQAIINDKVVKAGEMIGQVKVVSIAKEGLVFLFRNKQYVLPAPGLAGVQKSGEKRNTQIP
jgi:hypothetical protein